MIRLLGILILFIFTISCNDYQKLLNSTENEVDKYAASEKYYNNGDFRRANALLEQISFIAERASKSISIKS